MSKEYLFEYTDQGLLSRTLLTACAFFFGSLILAVTAFEEGLYVVLCMLAGCVLAIGWYLLQKGKMRKGGAVEIHHDALHFRLAGKQVSVRMADISSYEIVHYNGVGLRLKMSNGSCLKVSAGRAQCNPLALAEAAEQIQRAIEDYAAGNPSTTAPKRGESFFERRFTFAALSVCVVIFGALLVLAWSTGKSIGPLLMPLGLFIGLWSASFQARQRLKKSADRIR